MSSGSPVEVHWTSTGILEAERNIEDNIIIEQNSSRIQWTSTGVHWSSLESTGIRGAEESIAWLAG